MTTLQRGEEALLRMRMEISDGHRARCDEGGGPGEEAERDQHAGDDLDHPGRLQHRIQRIGKGGREMEEFLHAMRQK